MQLEVYSSARGDATPCQGSAGVTDGSRLAKKIRDPFVQRAGGARGVPRAHRATLAGPQVLRGPAAHALAVEQRRAARGPDAALRQRGHEPVQEHLPRLRAVSYIQMRESRLITHLFNPYLL